LTVYDLAGARPPLVFRRARADDAGFLSDLAGEAFDTYGDYRAVLASWASDPYVEVTLAVLDGERAGAAFLVFIRPGEAPHTRIADLLALGVVASLRGRGLGRALLDRMVRRSGAAARLLGVEALRLTVAESNVAGRHLFETAGFRYYEGEGSYPNGQKALHMRLPLTARGRRGPLL